MSWSKIGKPSGPVSDPRLSYSSKIGPKTLDAVPRPQRNQSPLKMPGTPPSVRIRIAPNVFKIGIVGPS